MSNAKYCLTSATCYEILVDCMWSSWEEWSTCSKSCGGGKRSSKRTSNQSRQLIEGDDCPAEDTREEQCNVNPCPGIDSFYL